MGEDSMQGGEMSVLIAHGRVVRPAPDLSRARALVRARAVMQAGPPLLPVESGFRRARRLRVALAGLAAMAGGAVATAVVYARARDATETTADIEDAQAPVPAAGAQHRGHVLPAAERVPRPAHVGRTPGAAELRLLRRAQDAYVAGDQRLTLALLAEHTRRFPQGCLAEERDALRVRALVDAGQPQAARQAAAAFARRYPHSVLIPHIRQAVEQTW